MTAINSHIQTMVALRVELIKKRRAFVEEARAIELPEIVAQIEAVDRSISDEKALERLDGALSHR